MKHNKKNIGIGVTALLAATAAASVFAAGTTTTTNTGTTAGQQSFGRRGSHTETETERKEHQLAMATSLAKALGTTVDSITSQLNAGKSPRDIIKASGLDEATIKAQLEVSHEADMKARLAADVASGKLTQVQADQMLSDMKNHEGMRGKGGKGMYKDNGQMLANAATILGTTKEALQAQITTGKDLKEIVAAAGISETDFRTKMDALRQAEVKTRFAAEVAAGTLTQAQADQRLADMASHKGKMHFMGRGEESAQTETSAGTSNF